MCVVAAPILMAVSAAATVASTAFGIIGAQQQASAQAQAANYQAQVARNNAIIQERNAQAAIQAGETEAQNQQRKTAATLGAARAAMAASGLDTTSGTPLDLQSDIVKLGKLDELTIRNNAARTAYGYRIQGMSNTAEADLAGMRAKSAVSAGNIASMSTLLSGATSLSDKFMGWQRQGLLT